MNKKYTIYIIVLFSIIYSLLPLFGQSGQPLPNAGKNTGKNTDKKTGIEEKTLDYNTFYRFPFSLGLMYKAFSSPADYNGPYFIQDINGQLHWPWPNLPSLQPTLTAGLWLFDSQATADPERWDHFHLYSTIGLAYTYRFSKNFELGGFAAAGISQAYFNHLLPDVGTLGTTNVLLELGGSIGLSPSYNLNINLNPGFRYVYTASPLQDFNGFLPGIGLAVHFRFGEDPDIARQIKRYLSISPAVNSPLFASMQNYYTDHPIGKVNLLNTQKQTLTDVQVAFAQAGYMDSPTVCVTIPEIKSGVSLEVPLFASFNEEVFRTEGVIPLTGEIQVSYTVQGRQSRQTESVVYDLYDKRALVWDDDRKIAALITPADSSLRNYVSFIHQIGKNKTWPALNAALQSGIQLYNALSALGCIYQPDPQLPFSQVKAQVKTIAETRAGVEPPAPEQAAAILRIDTVNLPRETLKQIAGDCDDLTVLYCALLETMGIESGFITTPGHIFPAFNTKLPARQYARLHPDRQFSININGELWIPVEITKLGQNSFLQAWERGAKEWYIWELKPENRNFYKTSEAQRIYRPVGLKETDLGLQYGSKQELAALFERDMNQVAGIVYSYHEQKAAASGLKEDYNKLGIICSEAGRYDQAGAAFRQALGLDPSYLIAKINLGHVAFYEQQYEQAIRLYQEVLDGLTAAQDQANLSYKLNLTLCLSAVYYELKAYDQAALYYAQARQIDPEKADRLAYVNLNSEPAGTKERSREFQSRQVAVLFAFQESP